MSCRSPRVVGHGLAALIVAFLTACSSGDAPSSEEAVGSARAAYGDYVLEHRRWESTFVGCLTDAGLAPRQLSDASWEGFSEPNRPSEPRSAERVSGGS